MHCSWKDQLLSLKRDCRDGGREAKENSQTKISEGKRLLLSALGVKKNTHGLLEPPT